MKCSRKTSIEKWVMVGSLLRCRGGRFGGEAVDLQHPRWLWRPAGDDRFAPWLHTFHHILIIATSQFATICRSVVGWICSRTTGPKSQLVLKRLCFCKLGGQWARAARVVSQQFPAEENKLNSLTGMASLLLGTQRLIESSGNMWQPQIVGTCQHTESKSYSNHQ